MDSMDRKKVKRKPYVKKKKSLIRRLRWKRIFGALLVLGFLIWGVVMACGWAYDAITEKDEVTVEESVPAETAPQTATTTPANTTQTWQTNALPSAIADAKLEASRQTLNVLFIGVDDTAKDGQYGQADSVVLLIVDPDEKSASMISIPSYTKISVAGHAEKVSLKQIYQQGGTPQILRVVEGYLGITIPYYAAVDHAVFTRAVDELGGVDLYVETNMSYTDSYDGYTIDLKKGYQTLDGEKAQQYIRYRDDELGEFGRMKRLHRFVKAMVQQHAGVGTLVDVPALLSIMEDESDTNLTFYPMMKIANVLAGYQTGMTFGELLPGKTQYDAYGAYWDIDQVKTDAMFARIFKLQIPENTPAPQPVPAVEQSAAAETKKEN